MDVVLMLHSVEPFMARRQEPLANYPFADNGAIMTPIETISANLTEWMSHTPALSTIKKLAERSGVGFGTIRRMKSGESNPTVDNVQSVAEAFGRTAIDLLTPPGGGGFVMREPPTAVYQLPANTLEPPIDKIVANARAMTRDGQFILLGQSQVLASQYARSKANGAR
jgi:transcriptional regulator with XRE-family HTH domain